jgi:hypothetical protein
MNNNMTGRQKFWLSLIGILTAFLTLTGGIGGWVYASVISSNNNGATQSQILEVCAPKPDAPTCVRDIMNTYDQD